MSKILKSNLHPEDLESISTVCGFKNSKGIKKYAGIRIGINLSDEDMEMVRSIPESSVLMISAENNYYAFYNQFRSFV